MNTLPKTLHYKTTIKRLKDLINHPDFNELKVSGNPSIYTYFIDFPTGETVEVWTGASEIVRVVYHNAERTERGELKGSNEFAGKFINCAYLHLDESNELNEVERTFIKEITSWMRCFRRGYAKSMLTIQGTLNA